MTGSVLGHYEIGDRIGAGGMGVVYKARDSRLARYVALKVLPPGEADPESERRFLREARAASALNHPNIVTIHEIGTADGVTFLAMEYIEGRTLHEWIRTERRDPAQVLSFAIAIADAVAEAHAAGILHRDLKPSNIMVTRDGGIKILDFGLAKRAMPAAIGESENTLTTEDPALRTAPGVITGTPAYLSPEQAEGKPLDARSDMFSFGAVLYEMLSGKAAFTRPSRIATIAAVMREEVPRVSGPLDRIVARCLAKDPDRRFASMIEVRAALVDVRARLDRRRRMRVWIAVAAALVMAVLAYPAAHERFDLWRAHRELPAQLQLAVLPFHNVGGDPANQVFCDGVAETLASTLTGIGQFHSSLMVVPASEVRSRGIDSPSSARKNLGVNLVITGSVQRTGDQIRLTANLVDTATVRQIGSWHTEIPANKLDGLQDDTVVHISDLLNLAIDEQQKKTVTQGSTNSPTAFDLYLQARGFLQRYDKAGNIENAIALLRRATEIDSHYALAYSSLSEAYWRKYVNTRSSADLQQARDLGLHAIQVDGKLAAAHVNLATAYRTLGDAEKAISEYREALRIDPANSEAFIGLGTVLAGQGQFDQAEAVYRNAIQVRPGDWIAWTSLGQLYSNTARYREAAQSFEKAVALTPDNPVAVRNLAVAHSAQGEYDRAADEAMRSLQLQETPAAYRTLATIRFRQGRIREMIPILEKALALSGDTSYTILGDLANAYRWTPGFAAKAPAMYQRAIEVSSRAITTNPRDAYAMSYRALYLAKTGKLAEAKQDTEKAHSLRPKDVQVTVYWAIVQEMAHQRARALEGLTEALSAGYPIADITHDPDLAELSRDPRFIARSGASKE